MARFRIEFSAESVKVLEGLDKSHSSRIVKKVESIVGNPARFVERLVGRSEYKLRIGDYRAILDIDERQKVIFVRSIGHRRNIYSRK